MAKKQEQIFGRKLDDYEETIWTTWTVTVNTISNREEGRLAVEILKLMAYLSPDNIPTNLFLTLANDDEDDLFRALSLAKQYSMITCSDDCYFNHIHRLVQLVIRTDVRRGKYGRLEKYHLEKVLGLVNSVIEKDKNKSKPYKQHISQALKYEEKRRADVGEKCDINITRQALRNYADILAATGEFTSDEYSKCKERISDLIKISNTGQKIFDIEEANTLAKTSSRKGDYKDALLQLQNIYEKVKEMYGEEDSNSIRALCNLASGYNKVGNYEKALELSTRSYNYFIAIDERTGGTSEDSIIALGIITTVLDSQGNYDEALKYLEDLYEKKKTFYGLKEETFKTLKNIATIQFKKGLFDDAITNFEKVYKIYTNEEYMSVHLTAQLDALSVLQHWGLANKEKGNISLALSQLEEVYNERKKILGEDNFETLSALTSLSLLRETQFTANEIFQKLSDQQGVNHPETLKAKHNVGDQLYRDGKYQDALLIHEEVYPEMCLTLGENHYDTLITHFNIALALFALGRLRSFDQVKMKRSLDITNEVYERFIKIVPETHPVVLRAKLHKANVLYQFKEFDEAVRLATEVYKIQKQEGNPELIKTEQILKDNILVAFINWASSPSSMFTATRYSSNYNNIALHLAVQKGCTNIAEYLIDIGADILATKREVIKPIFTSGRDADDDRIITVLHSAVLGNHSATIKLVSERIKEKYGQDSEHLNPKDSLGNTPLMLALEEGKTDAAKLLLDHNANVDAKNINDLTALHLSMNGRNDVTIIEILLKKIIDQYGTNSEHLNPKDKQGITPLMLAVKNKCESSFIQLLLKYHADPDVQNLEEKTALHLAQHCLLTDPDDSMKTIVCLLLSCTSTTG